MWDVITHPCLCFSDGYWRWSDGVMSDYIRLFYTDVITFLYPIPHAGLANLLMKALQWRHNERDGVSNDRRLDCLLSRLFRLTSKKTSKLSVTGLCEGIHRWPKRASNAKNVSIWWRHYGGSKCFIYLHTSVSVHQQYCTRIDMLMSGFHYNDVTMDSIASQITSPTIVYSTVYSDADQRKHLSSASLAFVWGIQRWPVNSLDKWPVTRKMFPFDDVIMFEEYWFRTRSHANIIQNRRQDLAKSRGTSNVQIKRILSSNQFLAARLERFNFLNLITATILLANNITSTLWVLI